MNINNGIKERQADFEEKIATLKPHDNLVLLYENSVEWAEAIIPFIRSGIEQKQMCLYLSTFNSPEQLRSAFRNAGFDITGHEKAGQILIVQKRDIYSQEDNLAPEILLAYLVIQTEKALRRGYKALRVSVENAGALLGQSGPEKLREIEALLNKEFFPLYPSLVINQYNLAQFSPDFIEEIIMTHPLIVKGSRLYVNPNFADLAESSGQRKVLDRVDYLLQRLEQEKMDSEALQECSAKYTTLFDQPLTGIYLLNLEGRIIDVNREACRQLGYTREELLNQKISDFYSDGPFSLNPDQAKVLEQLQTAQTWQRFVLEVNQRLKDGTHASVNLLTETLRLRNNTLMIAMTQDVTELKETQKILREYEEKNEAIFSAIPDLIFTLNREGVYLDFYTSNRNLSVVEPEHQIGKTVYEILPEPVANQFMNAFSLVDTEGKPQTINYALDTMGGYKYFETRINLLSEQKYIILVRDVTARILSEAAVKEQKEELAAIYENAPIIMILVDSESKIRKVNNYGALFAGKSVTDIIGLREGEALGCLNALDDPKGCGFGPHCEDCIIRQALLETLENGKTFYQVEAILPVSDHGQREKRFFLFSTTRIYIKSEPLALVNLQDITERKHKEVEISRRNIELEALLVVSTILRSAENIDALLPLLLDQTLALLGIDAGVIWLYSPISDKLRFTVARGWFEQLDKAYWNPEESIAGKVFSSGQPYVFSDLAGDPLILPEFRSKVPGGQSGVYVPIKKGDIPVGGLVVSTADSRKLGPDELRLLYSLAEMAGIAIHRISLFEDLRKMNVELSLSYEATIEGWSRALELRDQITEGHSQRVAEITVELATRFGLASADLVHVRRGCLLHDIGKVAIPDSILNKPDKLSPEEWQLMIKHPQTAYDLLYPIEYLRPAIDIPYCHHEKWDGSGYPRGLKGKEIPLPARIFAVVDVYDALTSDRPYRKAWSKEKTLKLIKEDSGKHFDPAVVEVFLREIG
ncbi:MAG: PAS domain S-box protein [Bacillota bacterium]|nr:PAS domain S-box protein [Bacillota bacterium]